MKRLLTALVAVAGLALVSGCSHWRHHHDHGKHDCGCSKDGKQKVDDSKKEDKKGD